jgi:hypothetical protein
VAYAEKRGRGQKPWRVKYRLPSGTETSESGFETKAAALTWGRDQEARIRDGRWTDPNAGKINFAKIALNVAHRTGQPDNVLADLLRSWFGADAGQPGTVQYVELVPGEPHWHMRPASPAVSRDETVS